MDSAGEGTYKVSYDSNHSRYDNRLIRNESVWIYKKTNGIKWELQVLAGIRED